MGSIDTVSIGWSWTILDPSSHTKQYLPCIIRPQPTLDLRRSAKMARMNQPIASLRSNILLKLLTSVSMWWSIWFVISSTNQGTSTTARHERSWHGTSSSHAPRRPNLMKEQMKNMWEPSLRWGCDYDTSFQFHNNWFPDGSLSSKWVS